MKIGFDARMITWGGVGRYTEELLSALGKIDKDNEYVIYCQKKDSFLVPDKPNFNLRSTKLSVLSPFNLLLCNFILKRDDLDIFHSPHYPLPFFKSLPFIVTLHDLIPLVYPDTMNSSVKRYYYHFLNKTAVKKADRIITVSNFSKNDLIKHLDANPEKIETIKAAADKKFRVIKNTQKLNDVKNKLSSGKDFILSVGNSKPHKNWKTLITAYSTLSDNIKEHYNLIFVGDKNRHFSKLEALIDRMELKDKVIFLEDIADDEIILLYNASKIYVQPSLYEGFGLPVLEAQSCGTPVICSNVSSLPEVAGEGAITVKPEDPESFAEAIEKILNNSDVYEDLKSKALENAENFSWEKTAEETLEIYEKIYRENIE